MALAAIFGCAGPALTDAERGFFAEADPWGFILFARNIDAPDQVRTLVDGLRESVGRNAPVLIDQEGGRVARLRPPHWRRWAPVGSLAGSDMLDEAGKTEALRLQYRAIGAELRALGIDVDCAPLLDIPAPGAHDVIGDRALGTTAETVISRARAVHDGLLDAGVLPVIKHVPGHGRTTLDSHEALPRVDASLAELEASDFAPFRDFADAALAMTAHIVFPALDAERCVTLSPDAIRYIRDELGLTGLLMSDDLSMKALAGPMERRTADALSAGCDVVLHCNGDMGEMQAVANGASSLSPISSQRAEHALALRPAAPPETDLAALDARYADLAGRAGLA